MESNILVTLDVGLSSAALHGLSGLMEHSGACRPPFRDLHRLSHQHIQHVRVSDGKLRNSWGKARHRL